MPVLDAQNLSKSYGSRTILNGVQLTIRTGERIGVVGLNGAGKSTLGRILAGLEDPDGGQVARRRGSSVRYLAQVPEFAGDPSVEQAVMAGLSDWNDAVERHAKLSRQIEKLGASPELLEQQSLASDDVERLGGWDQQHRARAMLERLGVSRPQAPVRELSGGEQRRVALAQILVATPSLAILDEPTNHLDAETIDWLEHFLVTDFTGGLLLITHDRYLLDRVATRTIEVSEASLYSYDGGYQRYLEQKAERLAHARRTEQNRQNFLRGELEWLRRQPKARGTKQKARIERAEQALELGAPKEERTFSFEVGVARQGKTLVELSELSLAVADRTLVSNLSLVITQGERIGIVGRNGTGKTSLLRAIVGEMRPAAGRVVLGATTRIAYFDQERSGLAPDKSVFDNVVGEQPQIELGGRTIDPYAYLERFGFGNQEYRQPVGSLSGGERARVALARLLRRQANLVILDEPTNDLDLASLSALEEMLLEFSITALVVTHDRWFLDRVATALLAFEDDARVVRYAGNYQALQHARQQTSRVEHTTRPMRPPKTKSKKKQLTWAEERELEGLLERIEAAEARVEALGERLSQPDTYQDPDAGIVQLTSDLAAARGEVETLTARWEELETKKLSERS